MIALIILISFILDSIVSNFISLNSLFAPLFSVMSLILIYPYFNNNKLRYLLVSFLVGTCYDLIYTNTIVVHGFLFLVLSFVIIKLNLILANNYINVSIMAICVIIIYRMMAYGLLLMTNNVSFDIFVVFKSIYSSVLLNVFYIIFMYILTDRVAFKLKIHKLN